MIEITPHIFLDESEIELTYIRAPGPGGQNVNKVATAVQLRFNPMISSCLSEEIRQRLRIFAGKRMTVQGEILIKANRYRTQERNKQDAIERLVEIIRRASIIPKRRKKTKPTFASKQQRLSTKKHLSKIKVSRRKPHDAE